MLLRDGVPVELGSRALDILLYLLERPGEVVGKTTLMRAVWGRQAVEDNNLTVQIAALRQRLGRDRDGAEFIVTVPRRGYVFAAPVVQMPTVDAWLPVSRFIGRAGELAELRGRMATERLVTITGMGGVGKTRLMLELVATLPPAAGIRVFRVDLAPVGHPGAVAEAVASAIGAGLQDTAPEAAILVALRSRQAVLVIDNAEHLVDAVGALARAILAACPGVRMVVTSRVSLEVPGESLFRLRPLPVPAAGVICSPEQALDYDAVRLFVDRAGMMDPDFAMADMAAAMAVVEICRRLDGIALAIEMAVPRLQVLSPGQFLQRLDQRFKLLGTRGGDGPPRQRSLRAMLEWSWELLPATERTLLLHLAVFVGTVAVGAAVAMLARPDGDWAVLDGLGVLVRASLLVVEPGSAEPRYRLLETTRGFALETMAPGFAAALRRRHLEVVVAAFAAAEAEWPTAGRAAWYERYAPDADNLRAALQWAFGTGGETELGLRLVSVSYPLWWELPSLPLRECRHWFDIAVARIGPATPAAVQARLWLGHSWRDVQIGDHANLASAERAVALFRALGDRVGLGAALWRAGCSVLLYETLPAADAFMAEAEQVLRGGPATRWLALTLARRADILAQHDDFAAALAYYDEALGLARSTGYWLGVMLAGNGLAEVLFRTGARAAALERLIQLRAELPRGLRNPLVSNLATYLASADRVGPALEAIREVVDETPTTGLLVALSRALETLAMLLAEAGRLAPAARMLGFVLGIHPASRRRSGGRLEVYTRLNAALGDAAGLVAEGAEWSEAEAIRVATSCLDEEERK